MYANEISIKKKCFNIYWSKKILLLIFGLAALVESHAQKKIEDSTHRAKEITVLTGLCTLSSIDELYSFQKYSGSNVFIGLTLGLKSPKNQHYINILYSSINRSPQTPSSIVFIDEERYKKIKSTVINSNYSYLRRIHSRHLDLFISANWINNFNFTQGYRPEFIFSSLAPGVMVNYSKGKQKLGLHFAVPIVSLSLRNAYHISQVQTNDGYDDLSYIKHNLCIQSLGKLKIVYAKLTYRYSFSAKFDLDMQYQLSYISNEEPRSLKSASGLYGIGLTYNF